MCSFLAAFTVPFLIMTTILDVKNLRKQYGSLIAVDDISFSINEGICFGLLGPNGAGKTTTIEIIEGITNKSSGDIFYYGQKIGKDFKQQSGIQFQSTALQDFLTVKETIELFRHLYTQTLPLDELVELCSLHTFMDQDTQKLSGGQRQRLLLSLALVNDPKILFLDEPTTGLDPQARRHFWDMVNNIKAQNKTIILTTHYMEEAAVLCDELIIMDKGCIVAQGEPTALLQQHFGDVILKIPEQENTQAIDKTQFPHKISDGKLVFSTQNVNQTVAMLTERNVDLRQLEIRNRNLEDLFIELTGKDLRA